MECVDPSHDKQWLSDDSKQNFDAAHPGFEVQFLHWRNLAGEFGIVIWYQVSEFNRDSRFYIQGTVAERENQTGLISDSVEP